VIVILDIEIQEDGMTHIPEEELRKPDEDEEQIQNALSQLELDVALPGRAAGPVPGEREVVVAGGGVALTRETPRAELAGRSGDGAASGRACSTRRTRRGMSRGVAAERGPRSRPMGGGTGPRATAGAQVRAVAGDGAGAGSALTRGREGLLLLMLLLLLEGYSLLLVGGRVGGIRPQKHDGRYPQSESWPKPRLCSASKRAE
jgi:hypothetical protein